MASITINGVSYKGTNVAIRNGKVYIDDKEQAGEVKGTVDVRVLEGEIHNLEVDGNVSCGDVGGGISASGSVRCANVRGGVSAGGSITCGTVAGSVSAGGSVTINPGK